MNIKALHKVFNNTQNSYKFFWWLAILEICVEKHESVINFNDIIFKVISKLWYPVNYFKLSFGKIDQCSKIINQIQMQYGLKDNIKEDELYEFLISNKESLFLKQITKELTRYVPYRFIRPWYSSQTRGLKDSLVNASILKLQDNSSPYVIKPKFNTIKINDEWLGWIKENYTLIKSFTLYQLLKYLEQENPNVSNLSKKLERPTFSKLNTQKKYWNSYIKHNPNTVDVFERKSLFNLKNLSIDHFLPWSYFGHDLAWNLHPICKDVNSSKNNNLPSKKYFNKFFELQFSFSRFLINKRLDKQLNDYYILLNCSSEELKCINQENFINEIYIYYNTEMEKAKSMGFSYDWVLND